MRAIKCELCGANDFVEKDGVFICQYCGTRYFLEETKKTMAVKVDNAKKYDNYKKLAERSFKDKLYREAYEYYDKMLELNPDDWKAVYKKGVCAAWQSTLGNFRIDETVKASKNAFNLIRVLEIKDIDINQIKIDMARDINGVTVAFGNTAIKHYQRFWEPNNAASEYWERIQRCINVDEYAIGLLHKNLVDTSKDARSIYIAILKNLVIYYCEICAVRKYKSGYNQYGAVYSNIWYRNDLRPPLIEKYNQHVQEIQRYDSSYIPPQIQTVGVGGCYIATAIYGSYDCPEVWTLRRFRDNVLDKTWHGKLFIKIYYAISPAIVKRFGKEKWFNKIFKSKLDKMVERLQKQGIEATVYNDKY